MAEFDSSKRHREETVQDNPDFVFETDTKKHKPFNHILSLLEEDEEEPTQDLSSFITTLQQELSSGNPSMEQTTAIEDYAPSSSPSSSYSFLKEEDDGERVMRHLLEASDDELGLPNRSELEVVNGGDDDKDGFFIGENVGFPASCDGLWEFEDVNANYYALLQSELFM